LNPLTILVELVRMIGRFIYVFIFVLFARGSSTEYFEIAVAGLVVFAALLRYLSTSYAIHEGHLIVKTGILVRNQRTIPLSAIQNINVMKGVVHRMLGLVDLKIETAAGATAEAQLSALSVAEAEALKLELTRGVRREEIAPESVPKTVGRTIYRISTKELLLAGATENRWLAIVGTVSGLFFVFPDQIESFFSNIVPSLEGNWVAMAAVALVLFFVGWVFSIVAAIFTYGNFEVNLHEGKVRRHYGLLNQVESVVPLPRIQVLRTSESVFQRWLRLCKLYVETAGSFEKQDLGGSALLSPLVESQRVPEIARLVLPGRPLSEVEWNRVSRKTVRIFFQKSVTVFLVLVSFTAVYFGWQAYWAMVPLVLWSLAAAWLHYKTTGYDERLNMLASRRGVLSRRSMYVPTEKVQSVSVRQSPLQRRLGVATVGIQTAALGAAGSGSVVDLPVDVANELAHSLHRKSADAVRLTGEVL
jgi:putative membrane protein